MTLYEIDCRLSECFDMETGEILDEEMMNALEIARDKKITGIVHYIKNLEADYKALKEEADSFAARAKSAKNKAESLRSFLEKYLNGETFESEDKTAKVSYRKSTSVNIFDFSKLPEEFIKIADPEPKKKEIMAAIKDGQEVPGAELQTNLSMQIK